MRSHCIRTLFKVTKTPKKGKKKKEKREGASSSTAPFVHPVYIGRVHPGRSFILRPSFDLFHCFSFNVLFRFHVSPFVCPRRAIVVVPLGFHLSSVSAFRFPFPTPEAPTSTPFPFRELSLISPARVFPARLGQSHPSQILSLRRLYVDLSARILMHICMYTRAEARNKRFASCISSLFHASPFLLSFLFFSLSFDVNPVSPFSALPSIINKNRVRVDFYLSPMIFCNDDN